VAGSRAPGSALKVSDNGSCAKLRFPVGCRTQPKPRRFEFGSFGGKGSVNCHVSDAWIQRSWAITIPPSVNLVRLGRGRLLSRDPTQLVAVPRRRPGPGWCWQTGDWPWPAKNRGGRFSAARSPSRPSGMASARGWPVGTTTPVHLPAGGFASPQTRETGPAPGVHRDARRRAFGQFMIRAARSERRGHERDDLRRIPAVLGWRTSGDDRGFEPNARMSSRIATHR